MPFLHFLNILSELIQFVFYLGTLTRRYAVPAVVYLYVVVDHYIRPALTIPYYYMQVRQQRLACAT